MLGLSVVNQQLLRLFLSHSWDHSDHRDKIGHLISKKRGVVCQSNLSASKNHLMHANGVRRL